MRDSKIRMRSMKVASMSSHTNPTPPDQPARVTALDPARSVLVQAPAGSGKTDLLTRRFLRLLAEVEDPGQIVAITFTRAAAAEMRNRILSELEKASARDSSMSYPDAFAMESLAARALARSEQRGWRLLDLSSQLRISTIDSFCRDLAVKQPIFSGVGSNLQISERPDELYLRAARLTLAKLGQSGRSELSEAIKCLLLWRDNGWKELENLLVKMLRQRDRWMHDFVLSQEPDWDLVRKKLERPFAKAVSLALSHLTDLIRQVPDAFDTAHRLAQFSCSNGNDLHRDLAERAEFPLGPYEDFADLEDARGAFVCLTSLLLTTDGEFRQQIDKRLGFPKESRDEKLQLEDLISELSSVPNLEQALAGVQKLPPARYTDEDWQIVRASFILLRQAAAELRAVFAEAGTVDFVEVSQIAKQVLCGEDNLPSDAAQSIADGILHLLVDEFQDTSRRQHEFVTSLIEAWPDDSGRTIFVVGDPMQSIYFFRDAEAELFQRVKEIGFGLSDGSSFPLLPVRLTSNFRTDPELVSSLNEAFERVFAVPDGSGIEFEKAEAVRQFRRDRGKRFQLHLQFTPQTRHGGANDSESLRARREIAAQRDAARTAQTEEIVSLIRSHLDRMNAASASGQKYRVAVLGRARAALAPIAEALRDAAIPFRAVELESLQDRPEILDAVSIARALSNPQDRIAWLGVLRAPWCGLSLAELHAIAAIDGESRPTEAVPRLIRSLLDQVSQESQKAVRRVLAAFNSVPRLRSTLPNASTGTLIQQLWLALGGNHCVDDAARANLDLFWKLLDKLPGGEQDLIGPALDAALAELCALPDPATSADCSVQLMTIHKSKGLEFEVVIVPDLQAHSGVNTPELLSWLERGLVDPGDDGELTEFLIAPLQFKGSDPGKAKSWVDGIRRDRETQEMRRILYVASTRAREELHLFAMPTYKTVAGGTLTLQPPSKCLLATAWPALAEEIDTRFEEFRTAKQARKNDSGEVLSLAASSDENLIVLPHPTILRRLPSDFDLEAATGLKPRTSDSIAGLGNANSYQRHEGGMASRALGNAVHKLLEQLASLRTTHDWPDARTQLEQSRPRIVSMARATGISTAQAEKLASQAFEYALAASHELYGQWILSPHDEAMSESGWAGVVGGNLHHVRVDRLFRGGTEPIQTGTDALWIVDYKTAHIDAAEAPSALRSFRVAFEQQLDMYAAVLRNLHGQKLQLRAGLYYPRMSLFDWWPI
jgi:ATP-dependent helicase/nuclease subunit A